MQRTTGLHNEAAAVAGHAEPEPSVPPAREGAGSSSGPPRLPAPVLPMAPEPPISVPRRRIVPVNVAGHAAAHAAALLQAEAVAADLLGPRLGPGRSPTARAQSRELLAVGFKPGYRA